MGIANSSISVIDASGNLIVVADGSTAPTSGLMVMGSDGTNAQLITTDTSGRLLAVGAGSAGSPAGGVITIQGDLAGTSVPTLGPGKTSTGNSTTTPLAGNATFTGSWEDCLNYSVVDISAYSDVVSATGGWLLQWSGDGTNVDGQELLTLSAASGRSLALNVRARYFRTVFTNGPVGQTTFRIGTILHQSGTGLNNYPINKSITDTSMSILTRSVIVGQSSGGGGGYVNLKVTPSGSLTMAVGDISGIVGQNTMANSIPVVIASNQSAVPISNAAISATGAAVPSTAFFIGGTDGTNLVALRVGNTALGTSVTGYLNNIGVGVYNASPTTRTEGQFGPMQMSTKGSLMVKDEQAAAAAALADATANMTTSIYGQANLVFNGTTWDRQRAGVTALSTSVTGYSNVIPGYVYNASPTVRTEGQFGPPQADILGNLKVTLATLLAGEDRTNNVIATSFQPLATNTHAMTYVDGIGVTGVVAKAASGNLYTFWGYNGNAATRYIQVFNATSAPADGTAPLMAPIAVPPLSSFALELAPYGRYFSTGIYICNSTTLATKTLGSADMYITVGVG